MKQPHLSEQDWLLYEVSERSKLIREMLAGYALLADSPQARIGARNLLKRFRARAKKLGIEIT